MSQEIKIEKGIPIPLHASTKYPFELLQKGDSFSVERKPNTVYQASRQFSRSHAGYKFVVRKEKSGTRVWRIA